MCILQASICSYVSYHEIFHMCGPRSGLPKLYHTGTCIHIHIHMCVQADNHTHIHTYSYVWHTYVHTHTHTHAHTHTHTHTHTQHTHNTHTQTHTHTHMYVHNFTYTITHILGIQKHTWKAYAFSTYICMYRGYTSMYMKMYVSKLSVTCPDSCEAYHSRYCCKLSMSICSL